MKKNEWIKGAIILGLSFFIAILLSRPIGVSTQFSVLAGRIHYMINPNIISEDPTRESGYRSSNAYYDKSGGKVAEEIAHPINYSMAFVFAIPFGAWIAYKSADHSKKKREGNKNQYDGIEAENRACETSMQQAIKQENNRCDLADEGFLRKYLPMFIGGFLLLFGARFAGGCTSGHMMSGMMQSSLSGYVFAGVVFAVAIPTAIISRKINHHRR